MVAQAKAPDRIVIYEVHIDGVPVDPVYFFYNDLNAEQYERLLKIAATGSAKSFD